MDERRAGLLAKFRSIAIERLEKLNGNVAGLGERPDDAELIDATMREIHTLKGEARMLGLQAINQVAHRTEDLLHFARDSAFRVEERCTELILYGLDLVGALLHEPGFGPGRLAEEMERFSADVAAFLKQPAAAAAAPAAAAPAAASSGPPAPAPAPLDAAPAAQAPPTPPHAVAEPAHAAPAAAKGAPAPALDVAAGATVRMPIERLAFLTQVTGDLILRQEEHEQLVGDVGRLLRDLQARVETLRGAVAKLAAVDAAPVVEARAALQGGVASLAAFVKEMGATTSVMRDKALENRVELADLQEGVRRMRLLPLRSMFDKAGMAARELAREQGKKVKVVVEGADVSVDKQILDVADQLLVHLVRNGIDHGLETPEERVRAGKPEQGTLRITAREQGGQAEIVVADDGRGLDPARLRDTAVKRGLLEPDAAARADDATLIDLAFRPGFSTRAEVSDVSGRGVGLDVVRREVEALSGSVAVTNTPGAGVSFKISLPVSVALAKVLVVQVPEGVYALPSSGVERVVHVAEADVEPAGEGETFRVEGKRVPLFDLGALLGFSAAPRTGDHLRVVVLEHAGRSLGVRVAKVLGEREVVQRSLDPFLRGLRIVSATAVIEGGKLLLVVNLPVLFQAADGGGVGRAAAVSQRATTTRRKRRILVVDDSELTRDMLVHLTGRLGLEAIEAVDGYDAMRRLERDRPDMILTDLDMPAMDGIALIEHVRAAPALRELPIVVLSTRGSKEDKQRAMDAGANGYLVKSAFHAEDLQKVVDLFVPP